MQAGTITTSITDRFFKKTAVCGECLEWVSFKAPSGYGHFMVWGAPWRAHRVAWIIANGPIPQGMHVLHTCDNPACVKVEHLFLGTHAQNMDDMAKKGRACRRVGPRPPFRVAKGSSNGSSKLTEEQVTQMRADYSVGGITQKQLGRKYGVSQSLAAMIVLKKIWTHV